jgi:hypothetical protein
MASTRGPNSRTTGVLLALGIALIGSLLYHYVGPGADEPAPVPTPARIAPTPRAARTAPARIVAPPDADADGDEERDDGEALDREVALPGRHSDGRERDPDHPWAALAEDDAPLTDASVDQPKMGEMDPADPAYDPMVEAQQIFHPFEQTLMDADPLDPTAWKAALDEHRTRNGGVLRRADWLRRSGYPEDARDLMLEWSRLYGVWQARAYGRPGPPGFNSPPLE